MAKIIKFILLTLSIVGVLYAKENRVSKLIEDRCLSCHKTQSIPSEMIYRRYLLKYSSKDRIREKIYNYLRSPKRENSIMPPQFFSKFPLKEPIDMRDKELQNMIDGYIEYYDVNHKLFVE